MIKGFLKCKLNLILLKFLWLREIFLEDNLFISVLLINLKFIKLMLLDIGMFFFYFEKIKI